MIDLIKKQRAQTPKLCEIIRFLIVGGAATIIDMTIMGLLIYLLNKTAYNNNFFNVFTMEANISDFHVVVGTAVGFVVGLIFNYIFSLIYVYDYGSDKARSKKGFVLFCILSIIGLLIQTIGMLILYSVIGINEWISKILLVFIVIIFNYTTRKLLIFKENNLEENLIEKANVEKLSKKEFITTMLFIVSSMCLCFFMYNPNMFGAPFIYERYLKYLYAIISGGIVGFYLIFMNKKALNSIKFKFDAYTIVSIIYTIAIYYAYFMYGIVKHRLIIPISIISTFAIYCYSYVIVVFTSKFIKNFINEMSNFEKQLFKYIGIILGLYVICVFIITDISMFPGDLFDAFFNFDTGRLILGNYQINQLFSENDFRHFLMSLFIMPFTIVPSIIQLPLLRGFLISIIQVLIVDYTAIKLIHFLKFKNNKMAGLFVVFYLVSSTILLNVITAEKFIFSLFYIIATIDFSIKKSPLKWLFYIGAIGTLTTNVFLLPVVLFTEKKEIKDKLSELIVAVILFVCILMLSGQFNLLLFFKYSWDSLKSFSSLNVDSSITNNLIQYLAFNHSMFLIPSVVFGDTVMQGFPTKISLVIGIVVLLIALLGFFLNYKDKFSQISFFWQVFMMILFVGVGWGAALNEMFIYSSLFLWSTIGLIFKFLDKILKNDRLKNCVIIGAIAVVIALNSYDIYEILCFAAKYFPSM